MADDQVQNRGIRNAYEEALDTADTNSDDLRKTIGALLYNATGSGQYSTFKDAMFGFDNTRNTLYMPEMEGHGFTFITRPKLNLSTASIKTDRVLSMLNTLDPSSIGFAIRALLDTSLINRYSSVAMSDSRYFNPSSPFISVLSNRLLALNGWPDPTIDIETTEGGFFSESITYPKGSDNLARNYDISASFSDLQGSVIHSLFTIWTRWIMLATRGHITAYMEDIEARRMCFTSSIYRFVMDPSNRFITKWAKATGCFPRSVPSGAYFNYDANASNVDVAMNLAIPFTVSGKIEYMDPIILKEFDMLMEKFCGPITGYQSAISSENGSLVDNRMMVNFKCLPYIDLKAGNNELQWRYDPGGDGVDELLSARQRLSNMRNGE